MKHNEDVLDHVVRLMRMTRRHSMGGRHHSHSSERLLMILKDNPNLSSREIAELLDVRPSSLSEMLDRLEENGLAERTRDAQDSRVVRVSLSPKGLQELARNVEQMKQSRQNFAACFSETEKEQFCDLCDKLIEHLHAQQHEDHHGHHGSHHRDEEHEGHDETSESSGRDEPKKRSGRSRNPHHEHDE